MPKQRLLQLDKRVAFPTAERRWVILPHIAWDGIGQAWGPSVYGLNDRFYVDPFVDVQRDALVRWFHFGLIVRHVEFSEVDAFVA